jgi:hypothetical protein
MLADAHPAIASVGEIAIKPRVRRRGDEDSQNCSCGSPVGACPFWTNVFRRVRQQGFGMGVRNWSNDYRFSNAVLHRVFTKETSIAALRGFRRWAEDHLPVYRERTRRVDRVNVAFVRAVLEESGASVFFDTSKSAPRLARLLTIPEFDVRVATLVRDVRAYAASARRRGKPLADAADTWRKDQIAIRAAVAAVPAERQLLVRYEDLCRDPRRTLSALWTFCGVTPMEPPVRVRSQDHHVLGNNMRMAGPIEVRLDERWRLEMPEADQEAVLRIAGPLHRELGYLP